MLVSAHKLCLNSLSPVAQFAAVSIVDFLWLRADCVTLGEKNLNQNDRKAVRMVQLVSNFYHVLIGPL